MLSETWINTASRAGRSEVGPRAFLPHSGCCRNWDEQLESESVRAINLSPFLGG